MIYLSTKAKNLLTEDDLESVRLHLDDAKTILTKILSLDDVRQSFQDTFENVDFELILKGFFL